jgi:hypothetical protein
MSDCSRTKGNLIGELRRELDRIVKILGVGCLYWSESRDLEGGSCHKTSGNGCHMIIINPVDVGYILMNTDISKDDAVFVLHCVVAHEMGHTQSKDELLAWQFGMNYLTQTWGELDIKHKIILGKTKKYTLSTHNA